VLYFWYRVGNCFLSLLSNVFTNLNLMDMETCYKAFRRDLIQGRVRANIPKDGRFSVAPRTWGGRTGAHHIVQSAVTHICYTDDATPIVRLYAERSFVSAPPDRS